MNKTVMHIHERVRALCKISEYFESYVLLVQGKIIQVHHGTAGSLLGAGSIYITCTCS